MISFNSEFYNQIAASLAPILIKHLEASTRASKAADDTGELLKVSEAAKRLKMCQKTVLAKIEAGWLKAANVGSLDRPAYRISKKDLTDFYNNNRK